MPRRLALIALSLTLTTGCAGMPVPSAQPSTPASPPVAPPPVTSPPSATASSTAPAPTPTPSKKPITAKLQGEAGGAMTLNGKMIGRDDESSIQALLRALGEPDEKRDETRCFQTTLAHTVYRWGDVRVVVLREEDTNYEYGFSYPPGAIAGWRIDPTLDGEPGLSPAATGPQETAIGTNVATLKKRFTADKWDQADVEEFEGMKMFVIFVGDTTGAQFTLDGQDKVVAMSAGYTCGW